MTRVSLEFLDNTIPLFEKFLQLFQKSSPVVHTLYDSLCDILAKLLRRFVKPQSIENKYGSDLASVDITKQLPDKEIVIGESTRQVLGQLTPDQQKGAMLGMRSFFKATTSYLQSKLPLDNDFLRQLGCLNPLKREKKSTLVSIQSITSALQPAISVSELVDEWKVYQVDNDLPPYNPGERIEVFWNGVFQLRSADGDLRYKLLPSVVKSALVLAQTNAESEHSLSVNARIVTEERTLLSERTIVGIHIIKDAVRFYDPILCRPEKILITQDMKKHVRAAHSAYKERLERQREEEKKRDEIARSKEISEKAQQEREKLLEKRESLARDEEDLNEQEVQARAHLEAADELLNDATSKLDEALSAKPLNKQSVTVAKMMLDTAKTKCQEAMECLDKVRKKQKSLDKSTQKLLDKALPSTEVSGKKRKTESDDKNAKKQKTKKQQK